jgi:hypothetical protein
MTDSLLVMYICLVIVYFGHEVQFHSLPVSYGMRCNEMSKYSSITHFLYHHVMI